jgi:GalNAc-alpha-(1->4)-GalNAc-alpha-(1->3)-diNAcBac-PP-undecaprenol alpha-1,4-N-acetyl-D-galactosaminyltransferase
MKNIVVFTDNFGGGGAERVASLIINGFSQMEDMVVHVCVFQDINNYKINKSNVVFHVLADSSKSHLANSFLKIKNLAQTLKKVKPIAIFSFGPIMASYVYIAKKLSGLENLKIIDSERNDPRYEPVEYWKKVVRNFCYNHADILVCQTPMAAELLKKKYGITTKIVIIPNPITPNLPEWKGEYSKEIITAARLTEQKNLPMLIRAFEMLLSDHSDYHLTIYGEGALRSKLEDLINDRNLKDYISMPGFANNIHAIMQNAYMYVSSSDYEGISNSMLESLGIGLPIVCTDCPVGGASMYITDGKNGYLTPVGDYFSLYTAMKKIIENRNIAIKFSRESKKINDSLSQDKIIKMWKDLICKQ